MDDRERVVEALKQCLDDSAVAIVPADTVRDAIALLKAQEPITDETSDGYHTFNELYHHRAVLFSVIVANYKDRAWKSVRHHDGTMYDGMFIVGIDTPDGQATYHYDIIPYWDMFDCKVREFAPEWDGHTPAQAIERIKGLALLKAQEPRVMTLEEIPDAVFGWIEMFGQLIPCVLEDVYADDTVGFANIEDGHDYLCASDYNKTWRCWNQRPTDAQREAEPWN